LHGNFYSLKLVVTIFGLGLHPEKARTFPPPRPPPPPQIHLLMKAFDTSEPHGMIDGTHMSGSSARPCVLSTIP